MTTQPHLKETPAQQVDNKAPPPVDKALVSPIEDAFARYSTLTVEEIEDSIRPTVNRVIDGLETGAFRVAEPDNHGGWKVNEWLKKAVLLYFRVHDTMIVDAQPAPFGTKLNHASLVTMQRSSALPECVSSQVRLHDVVATLVKMSC